MPEFSSLVKDQTSAAAMGEGDDQLFNKKLSKEEKKAMAKAKRDAKKKVKEGKDGKNTAGGSNSSDKDKTTIDAKEVLAQAQAELAFEKDLGITNADADKLASEGTICTFSTSRKGVDARSRDINIQNFTLQHKGMVMLDSTEIVLNHGNRYGLLGRNGCGKSTFMKALGARAVPIPKGIDSFHLKEEVEASGTMTALEAVMSVDEERERLEKEADNLNGALTSLTEDDNVQGNDDEDNEMTKEEQQELLMDMISAVYERLDALDADTAETRARGILKGLGFTHEMQGKFTKDFSGGWRMRVSLARALFIQPTLLLLDEPTNHLDMEAVIWLEEYLSKWDKILLLISHSQDFLNNVCTHTIHFTNRRKLEYYDGNYDQFVKTKSEKEENQIKRYKWEQDQIKSMKEYIARFGHGTSKNAKQAQSKEKVLEKMVRAGLTEKPEQEKPMNFKFTDPGHLPPPVLAFHDVVFGYPGCEPLYKNVNFGVDLDSRVALVGPNGAGKTTLVKLMSGELLPTLGDIRPHGHLKLGRFTQHFVDVLDLDLTPLEFFEKEYPNDPRDDQRKYLGRFGVSGKMQVQKMDELSDGQKSRVVFAKLGRDVPHILLLDEPTNHLDMESIDALAKAVNEFDGGLVLVSHDMRLISQVAKEIWICDNKSITKYHGDIQNFKMDMRAQMGIDGEQQGKLRGDASVKQKDKIKLKGDSSIKKKEELESTSVKKVSNAKQKDSLDKGMEKISIKESSVSTEKILQTNSVKSYNQSENNVPANTVTETSPAPAPRARYIPPHLRNRK
eukprot:CAMPEP_0184871868 /NCGR_PEP_ID=MMETSP0580-20130426/40966_1 /TAXON_ID=1118495 /ORGANISM="Dactyliosolen fragilissimus" /LENGTH=787 /DNA_ID=CAMNT_0027374587 /DNA_START=165 /DNA_END=2528 /DNA_ORIENTATION=+